MSQFLACTYLCGRITGRKIHALNLSSYNYLGFAETEGPCAEDAHRALCVYGAGTCSTRRELGKWSVTATIRVNFSAVLYFRNT